MLIIVPKLIFFQNMFGTQQWDICIYIFVNAYDRLALALRGFNDFSRDVEKQLPWPHTTHTSPMHPLGPLSSLRSTHDVQGDWHSTSVPGWPPLPLTLFPWLPYSQSPKETSFYKSAQPQLRGPDGHLVFAHWGASAITTIHCFPITSEPTGRSMWMTQKPWKACLGG